MLYTNYSITPIMISTIKISNIADVSTVSTESFMDGDVRYIEMWNGFNFCDLLKKIGNIMEKNGQTNFNLERILFYTKEGKRFDFGCDDNLVNDGDYFNVAIIEDAAEQMYYAHNPDNYKHNEEDENNDSITIKERKEKFLSLLRLNNEESLRGFEIEGNFISRAVLEPVYSEGQNPVRTGTRFYVETIRIDDEIEAQLKKMGI